MITFLNKQLRFLLFFLLLLVGISFIFFGAWTPRGSVGTRKLGVIEGKTITEDEFVAAEYATLLIQAFHTGHPMQKPSGNDDALAGQTWARFIALETAKQTGIEVSDSEIVREIKTNKIFQEKGQYSPTLYDRFCQYYLAPQGVSVERFHEMIRQDIIIRRMLTQVANTAVVAPSEVDDTFADLFSTYQTSMVTFSVDSIKSTLQPTQQDLETFYKKYQAQYKTPQKRKVEWVEFTLSPQDKQLKDKERQVALSKLGEQAFNFTGRFASGEGKVPDFKTAATETKLTLQTSDWLSPLQAAPGSLQHTAAQEAIFRLTLENPVSDYVTTDQGVLVIHLVEIKPSEQQSFSAVAEKVKADWQEVTALQKAQEEGAEFAKEVRQKLVAGTSWDEAVATLKQKATPLAPFIPAKAETLKTPLGPLIRYMAQKLRPGQVSEFQRTPTGGIVLYIKERTAPSEKDKNEITPRLREQVLTNRQTQVIDLWLRSRMLSKGNQLPPQVLQKMGQEL